MTGFKGKKCFITYVNTKKTTRTYFQKLDQFTYANGNTCLHQGYCSRVCLVGVLKEIGL